MREIAKVYDADPEKEWSRLERSPWYRLEFDVFLHHICAHLRDEGLLLDAGGGPGRYSIELCRLGYRVVLLDLSAGCIQTAKSKFAEQPEKVQARLENCVVADVTDMSCLPDQMFNGVLCLDPLSCLADDADRHRAISEVVRVAKRGAMVALGARGYLAVLRTIIRIASQDLVNGSIETLQRTGNCKIRGLPHHFFRISELKRLAESHGLKTILMAGGQGLSAGLPEATNAIAEDPEKWERWKEVIMNTSTDPAVADLSEHMLYLGRME